MGWHPPLPDVLARGAVVNRECRLSLARLHAAAPGVLDAIACFDGDFQEAPIFHPPLWDGSRWMWDYDWSDQPTGGLFLDLRIPSVAARLAGLCARALGMTSDGWRIEYVGMTWLLTDGLCQFLAWDVLGKPREGTPAHLPLILGRPFMSPAHFLAALTLALAPKIAVLR